MYKPLELFIGLRYTRAKRRNHFISFVSLTSMLGIALGVTALITVMSVMNGFEKEVRERILDMIAHVTVRSFDGRLRDWQQIVELTKQHPRVLGAAPFVEGEGMLMRGSDVRGALVWGILPEREATVSSVASKMEEGRLEDLKPGEFGIVLGRDLARILGLQVGDKVTLVTPTTNVTPAGVAPRMKRFKVVGIFYVGMSEYDSAVAFVHMRDAQVLYRLGEDISGVRVKIDDLFEAPFVSAELKAQAMAGYWVRDWTSSHANWFRAVQIEKRMIFLLLMLIIIVAAVNMVSMLVMVVTEKRSDIAILRTLGATPFSITKMFIVQGAVIGTIGTLAGVVGGVSLAFNLDSVVGWIEHVFNFRVLPPGVYYITELPTDLHWNDVWMISVVSFSIGLVATLYPAWRAAKTDPAQALRYE